MNKPLSDLRKFAESFFTNLGCTLTVEKEALVVSKVPNDFEASYGKAGPYRIFFDSLREGGELLSKGSFLLKTMTTYLDQRGQTALVRLTFDQDYLAAFKRSFSFKKCELVSLTKKPDYHPIYLFSFGSTLQYLNEKEQVMNLIAIREGKVIPFSLEEHPYETGNPKDIGVFDVKEAYSIAKNSLKELVGPRVQEISEILSEKIKRESDRMKEHYAHQLLEKNNMIKKIRDQIASIDKNPTAQGAAQRRERLNENLKVLEDASFESKLNEERDFFIRDEEFKHSLNVSNKLVSTTLVYYPKFTFTLSLKNNDVTRGTSVVYDPLKNDFESAISCEQCKRAIREIFLCSSSHILCVNCFDSCRSCERGICSLCMKKTCSQCARKLCKRCVARCTICWKDMCTTHLRINYATGKEGCTSCLRACSRCGLFADAAHLKKDASGSEICLKCSRLSKALVRN